ncbi:ABC transporter ATP-binding protein [Arboricoccus pini]|nr:ABC transporter ATP-binding protein [Arboricoccus pini]
MHIEPRLWQLTRGVRGRIALGTLLGLTGVALGILRLALLGWMIGQAFAGKPFLDLLSTAAAIVSLIFARALFEHWRTMTAHRTAAIVQAKLRRQIFDKVMELGPGGSGRVRSGTLTLSLIDGVDRLETYFGQFLPQFLISLLTPAIIFIGMAFVDLPVAFVMLGFSLLALLAPALWHKADTRNALALMDSHGRFASEFLDAIQGLVTLKAFGQSTARAEQLERHSRELYKTTMRVVATNVAARGITDSAIACGAAAALALGAWRVGEGSMSLAALLIILMLGVEVFRPMRELRTVLHQGMIGLSAAQGIFALLDLRAPIVESPEDGGLPTSLEPSVHFQDVRFCYPGTRRVIHEKLDFKVAPGERVGLVGPSGGGKSSIVRLLLRLYDPDGGAVLVGGKDLRTLPRAEFRRMVAVVNQDTFLFHGTLRDNLLLGRPLASDAEIEAATRAANIHDFITSLPQGYATQIGERGVKLSGGQRQRLAIARAILRDAPILVLDEALSAVDGQNEAVIQEALDRLMRGRTVLVLAHRLSSVIGCDRILVLKDGRVREEGDHATLMRRGGIYAGLMAQQAQEAIQTQPLAPLTPPDMMRPEAGRTASTPALTEGIIKAQALGWPQLVIALMRLVLPWKGRVLATFVLGVTRVLAFIGVGVLSAFTILALKNGQPYAGLLWALAVVAPLSGVLHWLESWIAHDMAFRLLAEMRLAVFRKLDALAPGYLMRRRTGDLMSLVTNDVELVEYFFAHTVAPAFVALLMPTLVLAVLGWASPWLALVLLPFLLVAGLSPLWGRRRIDRLGSLAREAGGELASFAVDSIQGMSELIAFQRETARASELDELTRHHIALRLPFFAELSRQQVFLEALTGLGGLAIVLVGAQLAATGSLQAGWLPLLTLLAMAAFLPIAEIAQVGRQLADTLGATRRLFGLESEPVIIQDGPGVPSPLDHAILLKGVSFSYPGQHHPALDGIDLSLPAGRTTALVGMSGAGKSTLAQLLLRFFDPAEGQLSIGGHDLRAYGLNALRRRIAFVAQDTYLFNDTLRANVMMARPEASAADLATAVRLAALDELVAMLPEGLETVVGERGAALSGGQRQRVAIARAFLKDAPILILDEATSHLDTENEKAIRQALDALKADRTTIVIAHRLATVRDADLIVVMDQGRVVEQGRHADLLSQGGLYARLVASQLSAGRKEAA